MELNLGDIPLQKMHAAMTLARIAPQSETAFRAIVVRLGELPNFTVQDGGIREFSVDGELQAMQVSPEFALAQLAEVAGTAEGPCQEHIVGLVATWSAPAELIESTLHKLAAAPEPLGSTARVRLNAFRARKQDAGRAARGGADSGPPRFEEREASADEEFLKTEGAAELTERLSTLLSKPQPEPERQTDVDDAALERMSNEERVRYLQQLTARSHDELNSQYLAGRILVRLRDFGPQAEMAVPVLAEAFRDPRHFPHLRREVVATLMWIGEPAAEGLVDLLLDPDLADEKLLAEALSMIGPDYRAAVPRLVEAARTREKEAATAAARVLANVGPEGRRLLLEIAADGSPPRRQWALVGLGEAGAFAAVDLARIAADSDQFEEVRIAALEQLVESATTEGTIVTDLVKTLDADSERVVTLALDILGQLGENAAPAVSRLVALLGPADEASSAGAVPSNDKARTRVEYDSYQPGTPGGAVLRTLAQIGPAARPAVPALVELFAVQPLREVTETLTHIGPDAASLPVLLSLLDSRDHRFQVDAVLRATELPVIREAKPELLRALQSPSRWVRAYAAVLIGELGAEAGDAVVALQQLLQQDEDAVVLASAFALGTIGPAAKDALPDLKRLLAAGRPEPVANEIRRAVQVLEVQHGRS
jgi:hypothetical protein